MQLLVNLKGTTRKAIILSEGDLFLYVLDLEASQTEVLNDVREVAGCEKNNADIEVSQWGFNFA